MGIVPIHLLELSPPSLRTSAVGTCYQLGNLASSASSTIEAKLGENFPLSPLANGLPRYHYGKVICIFTAACLAYNVVITFFGPEKRGASLASEDDPVMHKVVGTEVVKDVVADEHHERNDEINVGRAG
jgi:MFS transporter, SHS family, lactate transporter